MIKRSLLLSLLLAAGAAQAQDKAAAQPDLTKAKQTAEQVCGACHGADGNSQIPANPKLAGQHAEYLFKQLTQLQERRTASPPSACNGIMGGMVAALSDDDMKGLAAHFAEPGAEARIRQEQGLHRARPAPVARRRPEARHPRLCRLCHGPAGAGLPARYPRIGRSVPRIHRSPARRPSVPASAPTTPTKMMRTIALKMTDPDIKAVSDFAAGLR